MSPAQPNNIHSFFEALSHFLEKTVAPISNELDSDAALLQKCFKELIKIGGLTLLVPEQYGGLNGDRAEWIACNMQMAMYSGALLFLQAQHQFAVSVLKKLLPQAGVEHTLRSFIDNQLSVGIALTANRGLLQAVPSKQGFTLTGHLRWVTGFEQLSAILLSFDYDNVNYYTLLPFQAMSQNEGSLHISPIIPIAVFSSTQTVSINVQNWFVPNQAIIATQPASLKKPGEHPSIYNFAGAAKALLTIAAHGKYGNRDDVKTKCALLKEEWQAYYAKIIEGKGCPLELRAIGLQHVEHCLHLARIACGAESLLSSHPLNRINREIWQYTIAGYSQDQLAAYLNV